MTISLDIQAQILVAAAEIAKASANFAEAADLYEKALAAVQLIHGENSMQSGILCMDLAETLAQAGDAAKSQIFFARMREIVAKHKDEEQYGNIGFASADCPPGRATEIMKEMVTELDELVRLLTTVS